MNSEIKFSKAIVLIVAVAAFTPVIASAITVTDDDGMTITFNATPMRIVSLAPSNTEILAALGLLDRVVGVTDACDYPPEVLNITRIGGHSGISIEMIAAVQPDLVLASDITPKETISRLQELGVPVVVIAPQAIDRVLNDIRLVGQVTGTETRADKLADRLSDRIAVAHAVADHPSTVAHVVWHDPLYVSGNTTLQNDVIVHAGGINSFSDRNGWNTVSPEEFLLKDPEIILVNSGSGSDPSEKNVVRDSFMANPQYASLSAVRKNHLYVIDADSISRPGPRIVDATEELSRIIQMAESEPPASQPGKIPKTPGFIASIAMLGLFAILMMTRK